MMGKKAFILSLALVAVLTSGVTYFLTSRHAPAPAQSAQSAQTAAAAAKNKEVYSCPMHPSIVSDHPGKCPICGMDLQKVEGDEETPNKERKLLFYRHPMRPDITSPTPAKDEMGMDYVPVYSDEAAGNAASNVEGRASFTLSQERQQLIGVTTTKAEVKPLAYDIRASGKVAFDPELYTAIEEYRQALASRSTVGGSSYQSMREQADALVESARTRLRLMGLSDGQIKRLASSHAPPMNLLLPQGNVWVYAEVYEYELSGVKTGQAVEVTAASVSGKTFRGKLTSISPVVNAQTRTARVRALIPDPKRELRPDEFVNVIIKVDLGSRLLVPADAVLHSGKEDFVFVVKGKGTFEPRPVKTGVKTENGYEILSGISEGERIVTAANFLIDSESRLRGVVQSTTKAGK